MISSCFRQKNQKETENTLISQKHLEYSPPSPCTTPPSAPKPQHNNAVKHMEFREINPSPTPPDQVPSLLSSLQPPSPDLDDTTVDASLANFDGDSISSHRNRHGDHHDHGHIHIPSKEDIKMMEGIESASHLDRHYRRTAEGSIRPSPIPPRGQAWLAACLVGVTTGILSFVIHILTAQLMDAR